MWRVANSLISLRQFSQHPVGNPGTESNARPHLIQSRQLYKASCQILFGALGLAFLLVLLEILTRVADYSVFGAPLFLNYNEASLYTTDALGSRGRPFARYLKWQLNSLGFRGPEVQQGRINIICIGSSETFGLYEAPEQEFPRQLERMLNKAIGEEVYQVINVALPGETLGSSRLRIPEMARNLRPSYAVIYPSVSYYTWIPWAVRKKPTEVVSTTKPQAPFEWRISGRFTEEAKKIVPTGLQNWLREIEIRRKARQYVTMKHVPDEHVKALKTDLDELVGELQLQGIRPVLVTHANRFALMPEEKDRYWLTAMRKLYPMLEEDGFIDMERRMNIGVRETAAEKGIPLIDIAAEMPRGEKYFSDFEHFTTLGAQVMAEKLAAGLLPVFSSNANPRKVSVDSSASHFGGPGNRSTLPASPTESSEFAGRASPDGD